MGNKQKEIINTVKYTGVRPANPQENKLRRQSGDVSLRREISIQQAKKESSELVTSTSTFSSPKDPEVNSKQDLHSTHPQPFKVSGVVKCPQPVAHFS